VFVYVCVSLFGFVLHISNKNWTPTIFWNYLTKTDRLSMIFGRVDHYSCTNILGEKFDKGQEPTAQFR